MKKLIILISITFIFFNCNLTKAQNSEYRIANKFHIEGDNGWDYLNVDDATGRLYVSHGMMVQVVDVSNGQVLGTIPDTKGVHGIAIATSLNKGFISCGRDTTITVFDLQTFKAMDIITVTGANPDAILYDPFTDRVFTFNGRGSNSTVIDAKTDKVIETIPLDGKPEFSVTDGKGYIYVNIEDKSMLCQINAKTLKVEKTWSVSPGEEPSGLAIDNENHYLFSVCGNKLMVISDAIAGKVITTLPIGDRCDGVAFDNVLKRAYSSNGDGTITVVTEGAKDNFSVLENVSTQTGARTITVNSKTHHLYLPSAEFDAAPEPTAENPRPRPKIKPGTFVILDVEYVK
jgi:DNA-binding beta-propeller fold protein YncE